LGFGIRGWLRVKLVGGLGVEQGGTNGVLQIKSSRLLYQGCQMTAKQRRGDDDFSRARQGQSKATQQQKKSYRF